MKKSNRILKLSNSTEITDTGERILPAKDGELSIVYSRHKYAYEYVKQFVFNKSVIDIGCGTGYGSKLLSETAKEVLGVDYSQEAITYCNNNYKATNLSYIRSDVMLLELEKQYDIAVSFQVIEHIKDVSKFIDKLTQCVKAKGKIFISTPNIPLTQEIRNKNEYHVSEMNYLEFCVQLSNKFSNFEIFGVAYSNPNILRTLIGKTPIYKLGKKLKRKSKIKKIASSALDLTTFTIIHSNIQERAADLLAVCEKP